MGSGAWQTEVHVTTWLQQYSALVSFCLILLSLKFENSPPNVSAICQKLPVYQLQRQEGDQSVQRPSVLTRVHVSQGCTLDPQRQWLDRLFACLRQFQLCTLVFISAGGSAQ